MVIFDLLTQQSPLPGQVAVTSRRQSSLLAAHQENTKHRWICCFFTDKLFRTQITANENDLTQIFGIETLMKKIYTFQEDKNIFLFHMENKLWSFIGRTVFAFDYRLLKLLCKK